MHPTQPTANDDGDTVAIGLMPDPFITSGPWVVHPYWDSLPQGSAVPLYDTPCKPEPVREVAASHRRATHTSVSANNIAFRSFERIDSALRKSDRRSPASVANTDHRRWLGDLPWSMLIAAIGLGAVWLSASVVDLDRLLTATVVLAAVLSGTLLMTAQLIDRRRR